jgi:hypothetical protein
VSPVKYELEFYIPEDDILHSHCRDNPKPYIAFTCNNNIMAINNTLLNKSQIIGL